MGEKGFKLAIGGDHAVANGGESGGDEALAVRFGHGDGELAQRREKRAVLGLGDPLFFKRCQHAFHHLARLNDAAVDGFSEEGDGSLDFIGHIV